MLSGSMCFQGSVALRNFKNKYKNQQAEFDIDVIMDADVFSQSFSWTIVLWTIQLTFIAHKFLETQLLIWKPHPTNPSDLNANNNANRIKETTIFEMFFSNNHLKSLLGMVLMDKVGLFQTSFEYMAFTFVFLLHSFTFAADALINDYVKKVISK